MKTRIMFYLALVALFGFSGNLFAMEETQERMDVVGEPSEIYTPQEYDEIIHPQATEDLYNTFFGTGAGQTMLLPYPPPNLGLSNTFIGSQAGYSNLEGSANTFVGRNAGYNNTSPGNTFIGYYAGFSNTSEAGNTFVGANAGEKNNGGELPFFGTDNSFFGKTAGYNNTTGFSNAFFGKDAGYRNTTGIANCFFGKDAGYTNSSGGFNAFFGTGAGYYNNGTGNAFFGWRSGARNTSGQSNSFFGHASGRLNETGSNNTFFGSEAGNNNNGADNCFFGSNAGFNNTIGEKNAFFGVGAGRNNEGGGNVFLGYCAGYKETGSNLLYIDNSDIEKPLIWGDFATNNVVIYGNFRAIATSSSSDGQWKKNIRPLESSLDKISNLQGVSYEWKTDEYPDFGLMEGKQIGLVAQNVEKVLPELVSEDKDGYKAVSYTKLTAVLVEAVKELKAQNEKQQVEIERLRSMIKELKG